jgi:S-DNA-T family DNA segregation ATPase FtsK/SpoIIIE
MKNRSRQKDLPSKRRAPLHMRQRLREGLFLVYIALALFLLVSLGSYHPNDPGWSGTGEAHHIANAGGWVGAWVADIFLSLFGWIAYLFPILVVLSCWLSWAEPEEQTPTLAREWLYKSAGWILFTMSACALVGFYCHQTAHLPTTSGGIVGDLVGHGLALLFNETGSTIFFTAMLLCGITFVTGLSWLRLMEVLGEQATRAYQKTQQALKARWAAYCAKRAEAKLLKAAAEPVIAKPELSVKALERQEPALALAPQPLPPAPKPVVIVRPEPVKPKKKIEIDPSIRLEPGELPGFDLLNPVPPASDKAFSNTTFEMLSNLVEQRLADFGVEVKVVAVHPGPIITRFELDLAPGIKVSKITGLAKDIARSLSVVSVRVVEVIPGKSYIGLEIPNEHREVVSLREMMEDAHYEQAKSPLSLVLGKDIAGQPVVVDLAKMPHLLVAGTTGSGKSVSLNAMVLSILFKASPEEVRLIMIDPKMLELSIYDGIPHLLTPVITDMKDAANSLRWCVAEMDKRYRLMAALGVRNLAGYNQKVNEAIQRGEPLTMPGALVTDPESAKLELEPLPMIVVIADELADMMMVVGKKVEDLIARIAQKARAAGIHLIVATQRPSVDVITGLIKANIPTRIAFQVSSRIDSRTILDQQGAEQLLGHGDMLYLPPGAGVPVRVHGAYVADEEVHRVVAAWRSVGQPEYCTDVTDDQSGEGQQGEGGLGGESDPLYDEAVRIVTETRRASISLVQRRLRIGYNRAARMMEDMEAAGVVSSMDNGGGREVLAAGLALD